MENSDSIVFNNLSSIDLYLRQLIHYNQDIPDKLYICPDNFDTMLLFSTIIRKVETSILDFNLTLKLREGQEVTLLKYYKYVETPLYKILND